MSWDDVSEFQFRILGNDSSTFEYVSVNKDLWHNDGTYPIFCNVFNYLGTFKGSAQFTVTDKTSTSFNISSVNNGASSGFKVSYR